MKELTRKKNSQKFGKIFHGHQNVHTTQKNLQVHCDPSQNADGIIFKSRKNGAKIHMEAQKP